MRFEPSGNGAARSGSRRTAAGEWLKVVVGAMLTALLIGAMAFVVTNRTEDRRSLREERLENLRFVARWVGTGSNQSTVLCDRPPRGKSQRIDARRVDVPRCQPVGAPDSSALDWTQRSLTNANLSGADLRSASLVEADLSGADVTELRPLGCRPVPRDRSGRQLRRSDICPETHGARASRPQRRRPVRGRAALRAPRRCRPVRRIAR